MKLSRYTICSPSIPTEDPNKELIAIYSTRSTKFMFLDSSYYAALQSQRFDLVPLEELKKIMAAEILVPEEEEEVKTVVERITADLKDSTAFYMLYSKDPQLLGLNNISETETLMPSDIQRLSQMLQSEMDLSAYKFMGFSWDDFAFTKDFDALKQLVAPLKKISQAKSVPLRIKLSFPLERFPYAHGTLLLEEMLVGSFEIECTELLKVVPMEKGKIYREVKDKIKNFLGARQVTCSLKFCLSNQDFDSIKLFLEELDEESLKNKIFFAFLKDEKMTTDEFAILELQLFALLKSKGFQVVYVPSKIPAASVLSLPQFEEYFITACDSHPIKNQDISYFYQAVLEEDSICSKCDLFPVCGGAIWKESKQGEMPCPSYKYNIDERLIDFVTL